ncbi:Ig-like domain-containing protein [Vibrio coralliilyticus]|uniref:Ig-like domain-containing protein n=1 Tax=Vibrio coralliilyticus TaxID=190893 RepID=UPI0020B65C81|nr:Ig-like domain-containing protein [Vibrio coralliilyticus]
MRKLNILAVSLSAAFILAGCDGEESTTENIAVEVPFALNDIPMPNDGYGYDDDGSISLPDEPSSPQSYSTNEEYEAYYQSFETSYAAVDGWGLCVEPIEIPLDSVNSGQVPAIDQSSLDGNVLLMDGTGQLVETKLSSDGRKIVIECGSALKPGTQYHLAVSTGVKTTNGISIQPSASFTNLLQSTPSNTDEQVLQGTTQEAIDAFEAHGHNTNFAYASTFTTQNSYSVIDNIVTQTLVDNPSIEWKDASYTEKGKASGTDEERYVILSASLITNNYLPLTQRNANEETCVLDSYDPINKCPSMYKWIAGVKGEHLTQEYFAENSSWPTKIKTYNDATTTVPVDFYLPYIDGVTNGKGKAINYVRNSANPTVLFIHGITGSKEDAPLVAKKYVTLGQEYVFAAIDMPYHGMRTVCDSSDYIDDDPNSYCPGGGKPISARADKSYFINITSPLALRSNLHQSVSDFIGLRWAMNFGDQNADREAHLVGVSLGGIMSVMTTEATYAPNQTAPIRGLKFDTSNFVVPGQGLVNVVLSSLTLSSEMEESVKKSADVQRAIAETLIPNLCTVETSNEECITQLNNHSDQLSDSIEMLEDEIYDALIPVLKHGVQQTIDGADPAGKVTRQLKAQQPTLLIEAKGACGSTCEPGEYMPDTVVPNSAENNLMTGTDPLIKALDLNDILDTSIERKIRGVIRTAVGGHGTYLFAYEGPMDEATGLPSTDPEYIPEVNKSKATQQDAIFQMIKSKGQAIIIDDVHDRDNIYDNQEVTQ